MPVSGNTRIAIVAGVGAFLAGCWVGMGSDTTGQPFCVAAPAAGATGQLTPMQSSGCPTGQPKICGRFEGTGEEQKFVSDKCPDD
jgi:hypothetical protein